MTFHFEPMPMKTPTPYGHALWAHLHDEHGLTLTADELHQILEAARRVMFPAKLSTRLHIDQIGAMLEEALEQAARRKQRVKRRLADLRGDFGSTPVRGPWNPGRPGVKWHLWQQSRLRHREATRRVLALIWAIDNLTRWRHE